MRRGVHWHGTQQKKCSRTTDIMESENGCRHCKIEESRGNKSSRLVERQTQKRTHDNEQVRNGPKQRKKNTATQVGRPHDKGGQRHGGIKSPQNKRLAMVETRTKTHKSKWDWYIPKDSYVFFSFFFSIFCCVYWAQLRNTPVGSQKFEKKDFRQVVGPFCFPFFRHPFSIFHLCSFIFIGLFSKKKSSFMCFHSFVFHLFLHVSSLVFMCVHFVSFFFPLLFVTPLPNLFFWKGSCRDTLSPLVFAPNLKCPQPKKIPISNKCLAFFVRPCSLSRCV